MGVRVVDGESRLGCQRARAPRGGVLWRLGLVPASSGASCTQATGEGPRRLIAWSAEKLYNRRQGPVKDNLCSTRAHQEDHTCLPVYFGYCTTLLARCAARRFAYSVHDKL